MTTRPPLAADDARHGTYAGYAAGCRQQCCRDGAARYQRGLELDHLRGKPRTVLIIGSRRRIEALQALGWSAEALSLRLGYSRAWLHATLHANRGGRISRRNAEKIANLYDDLSMTLPPETHCTGRQRDLARRNGYAPPLSWDDDTIDDPTAKPRGISYDVGRSIPDPIVVERLLAGDRVHSNRAEKEEAMRRWVAMGRSKKSLCEMHGWHQGRYGRAA